MKAKRFLSAFIAGAFLVIALIDIIDGKPFSALIGFMICAFLSYISLVQMRKREYKPKDKDCVLWRGEAVGDHTPMIFLHGDSGKIGIVGPDGIAAIMSSDEWYNAASHLANQSC